MYYVVSVVFLCAVSAAFFSVIPLIRLLTIDWSVGDQVLSSAASPFLSAPVSTGYVR